MVKFLCFGKPTRDDGTDASSDSSEAPVDRPSTEGNMLGSPELTAGMTSESRHAFQSKFKRALKTLERKQKDVHTRSVSTEELQFFILAKIFSEEDAIDDFKKLGERSPKALLQILPFILNGMLYGSRELDESTGEKKKTGTRYSFSGSRKKKDGSENSLNVIDNLAPAKYERQLEQVIFDQCMKSVHFALHCAWYFVSCLTLGPKSSYHRTMRILLGMESVVMVNKTGNEDLFTNSEVQQLEVGKVGENNSAQNRAVVLGETKLETVAAHADAHEDKSKQEDIVVAEDGPKSNEPPSEQLLLKVDTVGDGIGNVALTLPNVESDQKETLDAWLSARKERSNFFHAELDFVKCLTDISYFLFTVPKPERKDALRRELEKLNKFLPKSAFIPVVGYQHRILRILPSEAFVFSTKERSPYLITFEVERTYKDMDGDASLHGYDKLSKIKLRKRKQQEPEAEPQNANYPENQFTYTTTIESLGDVNHHGGGVEVQETGEGAIPGDEDQTELNTDAVQVDPEIMEAFGEPWSEKEERIRKSSEFGNLPNWALASCIVKSRDQLRQEMFAMRLITEFVAIFQSSKLRLWVKPYQILATSADSGFIETINNAKSLSSIRSDPKFTTLPAFFREKFGGDNYKRAVNNFVRSMAGYSVVSYILAVKDRHNGNLMLDTDGHLCHIDFGFLLSNSPGGNREFEKAPFKLTQEMIDTMGGPKSPKFRRYRKLCRKGYAEACKHVNTIMLEVDMMYNGNQNMPCFVMGRRAVLDGLRERMMPNATSAERMHQFDNLIRQSMNNWTTRWYDRYQKCFTGIA